MVNFSGFPLEETSYYYPLNAIKLYLDLLPETDRHEDLPARIDDRVFIMTHDDMFDAETVQIEKSYGISSTFFLLTQTMPSHLDHGDIQLHFDKSYSSLSRQIYEFYMKQGVFPSSNRTHRLFWRSDFFDLAFLAFTGFNVDCTKVGIVPWRLCVDGKLLPIWEVPVSVSDRPSDGRLISSWNQSSDVETLFRASVTPIVASCHPKPLLEKLKIKSDFERLCGLKEKYAYASLNLQQFYDCYLKGR